MKLSPWCREAWQLWRDTLARWGRVLERRATDRWEPPPCVLRKPDGMPILEPMTVCPACDAGGAPAAALSRDERFWLLQCWECGYRWPQGETRDGWEALRDSGPAA